jgi:predicted peptidase
MSQVYERRRYRETLAWASFFATWLGMNLLILFGPEVWDEFFPQRPKPSWSVRRQFRIGIWPPSSATDQTSFGKLNYRILEPSKPSVPQPLLIFLHGSGERGDDNMSQLWSLPTQLIQPEWRARCPGFILAPQCPSHSSWQQELPALISLLDAWRNDPRVDRNRLYVTGVSMGGYGTWHLAAAKPDWFAAAVPICGGGDPSSASELVALPIWAVHGSDDRVVPPDQSRAMIDALRATGGDPNYTELPGVGHDSWSQTYRDPDGVLSWMYQQSR